MLSRKPETEQEVLILIIGGGRCLPLLFFTCFRNKSLSICVCVCVHKLFVDSRLACTILCFNCKV